MKHLKSNEPEFTAKALGEKEWGRPDAEINPEDLKAFESMEAFAHLLGEELKGPDFKESLKEEQVASIEKQSKTPTTSNVIPFPALYWMSGIAAALLVMLIVPFATELWEDATEVKAGKEVVNEVDFVVPVPGMDAGAPRSLQESTAGLEFDETLVGNDSLIAAYSGMKDYDLSKPSSGHRMLKSDGYLSAAPPPAPKLETLSLTMHQSESEPAKIKMAFLDAADQEEVYELSPFTLGDSSSRSKMVNQSLLRLDKKPDPYFSREGYAHVDLEDFKMVSDYPLSTFSIDVDTASYSNVRRFLNDGQLPPSGAVRIEEMINYFDYPSYTQPKEGSPFSVTIAAMQTPWQTEHQLVRIALNSGEIPAIERADANLVFLVDVSGSMNDSNKLPLVQYSLNKLVEQMGARDRIAVVVYAGNSGLALPSTTANNTETIQHAIQNLRAGGSTNGGAGIELAYKVAQKHFIEGGINRVILCTDGDFNVGQSSDDALVRLIENKRNSGVFFSILGFGRGNYQDAKMELLSNKGNGNFAYIDSEAEARKQLVGNLLGMLTCVAKDVKIQVEFNPAYVQSYRLIGYENRALAKEDFNDDRKDAGEIGAGHSVTALYEVVPVGLSSTEVSSVDPLKYQSKVGESESSVTNDAHNGEWLTVKIRHKAPDGDVSQKLEFPFVYSDVLSPASKADLSFASSVAGFGMKLRGDPEVEDFEWETLESLLQDSLRVYSDADRQEFEDLLRKAASLSE